MNSETCPVCSRQTRFRHIDSAVPWKADGEMEIRDHADDAVFIECSECGEYIATRQDVANLSSDRVLSRDIAHRVSALLQERTLQGGPRYWLRCGMDPYGAIEDGERFAPIDVDELLTRWPATVQERLDRTLLNFAAKWPEPGQSVFPDQLPTSAFFAPNPEWAHFYKFALQDREWLYSGLASLRISIDGWARGDELRMKRDVTRNPVFVAMWFGDEQTRQALDAAYRDAIEPAVKAAGYLVTRVDFVEHNDWIMDQVLAGIRIAPFVVADFTGSRAGVYFEAGFARGLGVPVIHSCREDWLDRIHFDSKQINHVLWSTPDELRERLRNRIIGSIGTGPHSAKSGQDARAPRSGQDAPTAPAPSSSP